MIWPGMGDPSKRKKTIRYLIITAAIGIGVALLNTVVIQKIVKADDPLYQCLNGRDIKYQLSATLEVYVDGVKQDIPANVGITKDCQRSLYTLTNDGVIHAGWTKEYPFEVGQFLWIAGFDLHSMDDAKSKIYVNGMESPTFIHTLLQDGAHYRAEFVSKNSEGAPSFTPPN
ncbi:MAG: hypothetical protein KGI27_09695 [Thaumarchaeota archaeon]|nr:hypothetical protein [Nitrososphaerota archaeon]